jgi:hypothetical protein
MYWLTFDPQGEWGCAVFRDAQGLIELDLDPIRTPNVHYDLEQLGPRVDQVQICNAPNTDPEVYL